MFGIIFPFLAAGFDEKTCLLPANYHPPHQTVINIPRHSPLPTLPLLELQTKIREYFTITEKIPTLKGHLKVNVKFGHQCKDHKGRAVWLA